MSDSIESNDFKAALYEEATMKTDEIVDTDD